MTIVTWNCNGAFRRKFKALNHYKYDVCVIQECEDPSRSNCMEYTEWASNYYWVGNSKHKGLGIFAKDGIDLEKLDWPSQVEGNPLNYFLPCLVNQTFHLVAVWAHRGHTSKYNYIGQAWSYFDLNLGKIDKAVVLGDFNSNTIWDRKNYWCSHSGLVERFKKVGLISIYHDACSERQGKESQPTFFLQKNIEKPYHIDYIFLSDSFGYSNFDIGEFGHYRAISDHVPLKITIGKL